MKHFIALETLETKELLKGAFASFLQTANLTIGYTYLKAGAGVPLHQHPEEAVDILLEGILEMQIGDITDTLSPGMLTIEPSNIPHKARAIEDCKVVTVFYPQR
jgi:quercetin dioxygenase-like cupin family protein